MIKQLSWLDMPELKPKNKKLSSFKMSHFKKYKEMGRPLENWDKWCRWQPRLRKLYKNEML